MVHSLRRRSYKGMIVIAGTGNRDLFHTREQIMKGLEEAVVEVVKEKKEQGREGEIELCDIKIISGMALGFDQILAEFAIENGIPFVAAIPFASQAILWSEKNKKHYMSLLEKAKEVVIVSEGLYAAWKMHKRNEFMVNECNVLLSYCNKTDGGAVACTKYAKAQQKRIIDLAPLCER